MDKEFTVYLSASPEMDAECEQIGQVLAGLTQRSRSTIRRTPHGPSGGNPDLAALARSDLYIIILGTDLHAPLGVEWQAAQQAGLPTLGYRYAEASPSPAMLHFMRHNRFAWVTYHSPLAFRSTLERTLLRRLLDGTPGFGLDLSDVEQIAARLKELEGQDEEEQGPDERRGAGSGGIILPRP
ncbi:MAG: hypothetical protein GX657_05205 [Chloroflexi bacterium]|jgi:hypothetical protein|nr:hypothetical protein [Chloroflexota bacterium]